MNLKVNGNQSANYEEGISLQKLIEKLGVDSKVLAAAVNMEIVKKDAWKEKILHENDEIELLHFVGGGSR
ncbi:thiamine biosynthesis protein ThiS [Helicobacter monodelphidis]|uniref:sulfur carrier protein ThiS n=1 Tax=Helicobacter sp. 15-1451 TaxID=2004995 RepID=UPI000DCC2079|nr:sulfur carrier protein ThiS [Helicobacter sp. 15-1451]RAX58633.1 thiamine biosynthesis protein ThiS [Helicobacter sp. 15-1451]